MPIIETAVLLGGKWLIGKAVAWSGGHALAGASAQTLQHLSMHGAANIASNGLAAGSLIGGGMALGSGVLTYQSFADALKKRKEKNAAIAWMKVGALGDPLGPLPGMLLRALFAALDGIYAEMEILDKDGAKKTRLDQIMVCECGDCKCVDFVGKKGERLCQACMHLDTYHKRNTDPNRMDILFFILMIMAKEQYKDLWRSDEKDEFKRSMDDDVASCTECGCTDFRKMKQKKGCWCGHGMSAHSGAPQTVEKAREFFVEVLVDGGYKRMNHSDQRNCAKGTIYEIDPNKDSGCLDFDYSWTMPWPGNTNFCKCGSRWISHRAYSV